jgi:hypothetical protein
MEVDAEDADRESRRSRSTRSVFARGVHFLTNSSPIERASLGTDRAKYPILRVSIEVLWIARLLSPSRWILSFFKEPGPDGRDHVAPVPTDLLVIFWFLVACALLVFSGRLRAHATVVSLFSIVLITDILRANVHLMIVRPALDRAYRPYNATRSFLLSGVGYLTATSLAAAIYNSALYAQFSRPLDVMVAFSLAVGIATSSGASGISPKCDPAYVAVGAQSLMSAAFLAVILSTALSRYGPLKSLDDDLQ